MSDKDAFTERRHALEEAYFRNKDKELIERLRRQADSLATQKGIAEITGVVDPDVLSDLEQRGFTVDMVRALPLLPFIEVAWADGRLSDGERELILSIARQRGIEDGTGAAAKLRDWLEHRPSPEVFQSGLRIIRAMLAALSPLQRDTAERDLVSYSTRIASASGGIFGFGSISAGEEDVLRRLAADLEASRSAAVQDVLRQTEH